MPISLLPFPQVVVALMQIGFPLNQVYQARHNLTNLDYVQWTVYWIITALWTVIENTCLWLVVDWFPFFLELKICFFLWLAHPDYKGAAYLWFAHLQKPHKELDAKHYDKIVGVMESAKLPDAAAAKQEDSKPIGSKEEMDKILKEED
eukprot:CAMPEP_0194761128 /NCGR_PEP_ID=MMETSP0323_2-20130528/13899_1 /TAXON_ID=2866 ORGANISM="Crypthecodinium cohnii, Strain Seligo" /NCGR_SAMPLE_ID=MMETSP0323_2 /ASSEMBLY_ACC=CAM_ASM_000346 /LENGTH=147 /DNA_ID=CAMNT_0039682721 /DNA_START=62 /DNA_END=505 /DNA_ORIENTATION=+